MHTWILDYITDDAEAKTTFEWRKIDDLEIFGANSQSVISLLERRQRQFSPPTGSPFEMQC